MKKFTLRLKSALLVLIMGTGISVSWSQTNVYDNIIATSPNHTSLAAALQQAGLVSALQNPNATLTVFAPDNAAFDYLASALGTNVAGLLALPNLSDILLYHVLGTTVPAAAVTNGAIVTPLSPTNTVKMTVTSTGLVYANHAKVTLPDLTASNGVVHSVNYVLLPNETVLDVAIDGGFSTLTTALATAELFPAVTDPLATLTVFAPTNAAFDALLVDLGVTVNDLLALPELADILLYHVLATEVNSTGISNGDIVNPIGSLNTLKMTVTGTGSVYVNHAQVTTANVNASNGVVHVLDQVVLPVTTVVDVAIDNSFNTLTAALIQEELLPVLTDPFSEFTVFAPTNQAFDNLATALGTDISGILALPNLTDVLLYHVVGGTVLSTDLTNGLVPALNGVDLLVDLTAGVNINDAAVTTPDVLADNGVVHVIDAVLLPGATLEEETANELVVFPNPSSYNLSLKGLASGNYTIHNLTGNVVSSGNIANGNIDISDLSNGQYLLECQDGVSVYKTMFSKN